MIMKWLKGTDNEVLNLKMQLEEAEELLQKISEGNAHDWQTIAAMRYFGWSWDTEGRAIEPGEE